MKKTYVAVIFICLSGAMASSTLEAADLVLRAGVLEFDEKNDIGLQNAKRIVPEYLISHLKAVGVYRLAERLEIEKALR